MQEHKAKVYSIQVSNISCINCAATLKNILETNLNDKQTKISINVMNEKLTITTFKDNIIEQAAQILQTTKYKQIGQPILISGNEENQRSIQFVASKKNTDKKIEETLYNINGVLHKEIIEEQFHYRINITYDSAIVKGRDLSDIIEAYDDKFKVLNQRVESLKKEKKSITVKTNIKTTIALCVYFLLSNMIIPIMPVFGAFYEQCVTFPKNLGIYSFSVLFNIALTLYVMFTYAKIYIQRAYDNYKEVKGTNMETLIALGSLSAFCLSLFFIVSYTIDILNGTLIHIHQAIMNINDSLTSASIIVLVVTIGKFLQKKAKQKIQQMTDQIFPQSVLFSRMDTTFVDIKNRNLVILKQKNYDVSLIQKNDIIRISPGVLLLDIIVINGTAKVTQSTRTGSEDVIIVGKGERIESGSVVHEVNDCLALVENVIEKSLLIELVTHIKFSQNQEESQASAVEVLCKKIANYFVKGVILLSIITMLVWTLLLFFDITTVPVCKVCWIIQRGIGVLVASCPCALGLAIPSVIANILNLAIKSGILIKKTNIFEKIKKAKIIAFDKTGTVFNKIGHIEQKIFINKTLNEEKVWEIVALLEKDIRHPLAEVIYKEAFNMCKITGTNFSFIVMNKQYVPSQGIKAKLLHKTTQEEIQVTIGNKNFMISNEISPPDAQKDRQFQTAIYVAINQLAEMVMYINTHSNLRPEAISVINKLQKQHFQVHILSGDSKQSVGKLGTNLRLPADQLHSQYSATDKVQWISNKQSSNIPVLMIGDGLNDIPCLQEAGIGISINAKSELNINAADVVILSENLHKILALVRFLKRGNLFININLFWAFAYNVVIMPITAGVFYPLDIFVSPVWSSVAMSCSSLLVVGFSHLLSVFHYDDSLIQNKSGSLHGESTFQITSSNREVIVLNEEFS